MFKQTKIKSNGEMASAGGAIHLIFMQFIYQSVEIGNKIKQ